VFDSEQGGVRLENIFRSLGLVGNKNINVYSIRHLLPTDRFNLIEDYILTYDAKIIFIDLGTDLTDNPNDLQQCAYRIDRLLVLAEEKDIHCCFTVHLSKTGNQALGHWGSIALRRCELVIEVKAYKDSFVASCLVSRDKPIEPFAFKITDGMTVLSESIPSVKSKTRKGDFNTVPAETHAKILDKCFAESKSLTPFAFKEILTKVYAQQVIPIGEVLVKQLQRFYVLEGLIVKDGSLLFRTTKNEVSEKLPAIGTDERTDG
jgi:hypothetical protein